MTSKFSKVILVSATTTLLLTTTSLIGADWPRWLGPNGDNIAPDSGGFDPDLSHWKVAWKSNVGLGYSAVTVAGNRAYTMGHDGKSQETVLCVDAATGAAVWKHTYDAQLLPAMHTGGPNATPTVIANRVITVSKDGQVLCLSADKGAKVWQAKLTEVFGVELPQWGFASSPVVHKGRVLFSAGKVAALDAETGKTVWVSRDANPPGYTTTVAFTLEGREFIAAFDAEGLSILNAADGAEVTRHPFKAQYGVTASTPFVLSNGKSIFISANSGSELLEFNGQKLTSGWTSTQIKNAMNNSVIVSGGIYGFDGSQGNANCRFVCAQLTDGKINWAQEKFGYGTVIGLGKILLSLTEGGELVTIRSLPDRYEEVSRLPMLGKTCWTTPTFANGRIYVRNDQGDVVCLGLK